MGRDDVRPLGAAGPGRRVAEQCGADMMPPAAVRVGQGGWALSQNFLQYLDAIRDLEVRPDDVWVLSFPKCGERRAAALLQQLGLGLAALACWPAGATSRHRDVAITH